MIGSATFDSLTELVQYYESNPLYRRMKLKYAINEEVLKSIGDVSGCGLGCDRVHFFSNTIPTQFVGSKSVPLVLAGF